MIESALVVDKVLGWGLLTDLYLSEPPIYPLIFIPSLTPHPIIYRPDLFEA